MDLKFRVAARIAKPVHEVFEAVVDPEQLSNPFTTAAPRAARGAQPSLGFTISRRFPGRSGRMSRREDVLAGMPAKASTQCRGGKPKARRTKPSPCLQAGRRRHRTLSRSRRKVGGRTRARSTRVTATARAGARCCAPSRPGWSTASTCARGCTNRPGRAGSVTTAGTANSCSIIWNGKAASCGRRGSLRSGLAAATGFRRRRGTPGRRRRCQARR